ncbi:MAG: 2Fe-2S iron-sulfur cluster-binding protein [Pseudomonadota bacterium]
MKIDGRVVRAHERELLLDVARREGIDIPTLCSVEGLEPSGACRLCIVKVRRGGREKIVTSCNYPVEENIFVTTGDKKITRLRKTVLELLVALAPASEKVRTMASRMGVEGGRLEAARRGNQCILCGLCVSVCDDIVGAHAITFSGRGESKKVTLAFGENNLDACTGCGACGFVCPTDCIDMEQRKLDRLAAVWRKGERVCRYSLMGLLPGALCDNDYDCAACSLDRRMFELVQGRHPAFLLKR